MKSPSTLFSVFTFCLLVSLSAHAQELNRAESGDGKSRPVAAAISAAPTQPDVKSTSGTELTVPLPKPQMSSSSYKWTGFYIGGNVGGTFGTSDLTTSTAPCGVVSLTSGCYFQEANVATVNQVGAQKVNLRGFIGGVQAGYNFQASNFVAGIEGDFNSTSRNNTVSGTATGTAVFAFPNTITQSIKTDWLLTVRPRAGFTAGRALIYGTGGLAVTNLNYQMNFADTPPDIFSSKATASKTIKKTQAGWAAGGGAEIKIDDKWSVKGEYLFTQFNLKEMSNNLSFFVPANPNQVFTSPNQVFTHTIKLTSNNFRFGINYRF